MVAYPTKFQGDEAIGNARLSVPRILPPGPCLGDFLAPRAPPRYGCSTSEGPHAPALSNKSASEAEIPSTLRYRRLAS